VSGSRGISVLIVDDDPRVRAALMRMLDELVDVHVAAVDSEQALRLSLLTAIDADVAVVDVAGPASRGEEVIRRLVPTVAVVAVSLSSTARPVAMRAGAARFLEKDGDAVALIEAIRAAAAGGSGQNVAIDPGPASHRKEGQQ
jgi:DNA-binding NarL/FixJ family response regulator